MKLLLEINMEFTNSSNMTPESINKNSDSHATEKTSSLTLLQMYDDGKLHIMEHCDLESIFTLRKTCSTFHNLIDNQTPDSNLEYIGINMKSFKSKLILRDPSELCSIHLEYRNRENGCTVSYSGPNGERHKVVEGQDHLDAFFKDLKNIIKHQKAVLRKIMILIPFGIQTEDIGRLCATLTSRNDFFKAENLDFYINQESHLLQFLSCMDPTYLQDIEIRFSDRLGKNSFSEELCNLPQWKMAKTGKVWGFNLDNMKHCLHFTSVKVVLRKMMFEDLVKVKKMMLQSPTLKTMVCECDQMRFPMLMNGGEDFYLMENDGKELIQENYVPTDEEEEAEWQD